MKTLTIGDIHGRPDWRDVDITKYDRVIFVGDLMDESRQLIEDNEMYFNTRDILLLKEENPEKVQIIPGNHDLPYMFSYDHSPCSRFRRNMYNRIHELYTEKKQLFTPAYQIGKHIWTHAGILKEWYDFVVMQKIINPEKNLADELNALFRSGKRQPLMCGPRRGGYDHISGHFWADASEHMNAQSMIPYHQIVGHSRVKNIFTWYGKRMETRAPKNPKASITFVDCLDQRESLRELGHPLFYELELPNAED
jgi:hypothetical protein